MRGVQGSGGGGRYYRPRDGTRGGRGVGWPEARTQVHAQGHHVFRIESGGLVGEAAIRMARLLRGSGHQSALVQVIPRPPGVSVRVSSASLRASPTTLCWALTPQTWHVSSALQMWPVVLLHGLSCMYIPFVHSRYTSKYVGYRPVPDAHLPVGIV